MILTERYTDHTHPFATEPVPDDAEIVLSALDAGDSQLEERRSIVRRPYRTITHLRLFRDQGSAPGQEMFTRDINRRGMGYVSKSRLPLGYGGVVILPDEKGHAVPVHCTVLRCREAAPGWYEGCVCFNREQPHFDL